MDESFRKVAVYRVAMLALSAMVSLCSCSAVHAADSAVKQPISTKKSAVNQKDHAMKRALHALRDAERELEAMPSHYGGHRATAISLTKHAVKEVERGLEVAKQENQDDTEKSDEINVASTHLPLRRRLSIERDADVVGSTDP